MAGAPKPEPPERGAERKAFLLRLPPSLMKELRGWAAQDLRSLNGQLEFLLREAVRRRRGRKHKDAGE
ncbi:MAG: Arc family DNA-binding protein [Planctomycetota bacterium]|nr:MAG: Arc family DNA-binding protein [Planctomycetota bacterium]